MYRRAAPTAVFGSELIFIHVAARLGSLLGGKDGKLLGWNLFHHHAGRDLGIGGDGGAQHIGILAVVIAGVIGIDGDNVLIRLMGDFREQTFLEETCLGWTDYSIGGDFPSIACPSGRSDHCEGVFVDDLGIHGSISEIRCYSQEGQSSEGQTFHHGRDLRISVADRPSANYNLLRKSVMSGAVQSIAPMNLRRTTPLRSMM